MNSYFHLYPDGETQQRLRLGRSLTDLHYEPGFLEAIAPYDIAVAEPEEKLTSGSWQELIVVPPIPPQLAHQFGKTMLEFAYSKGRQGTEEIGFIDHTGEEDAVQWLDTPDPESRKIQGAR